MITNLKPALNAAWESCSISIDRSFSYAPGGLFHNSLLFSKLPSQPLVADLTSCFIENTSYWPSPPCVPTYFHLSYFPFPVSSRSELFMRFVRARPPPVHKSCLQFHLNFRVSLSMSVKRTVGILIGIALDF